MPFACFVYNTTPHSVTKYTPYELLFGRVANIPGELQRKPEPVYKSDDIVASIKQRMQSFQQVAKERLVKLKELQSQKEKHNDYDFKVNDMALLRVEARHKLGPLWKGPYEVKELTRPNAVIQEVGKRKKQEIHINRLKLYFSPLSGEENVPR
jgi:hypothetical protein